MITFKMMAYGLYPRENFPEEMEEERRVTGRTYIYDEAEAAPREWNLRGNYVEDALIAMIDKQRESRPRKKKRKEGTSL